MATTPLTDNPTRNDYVASAAQTTFPYTFWVRDEDDILVFVNETLQTKTTDYTVTAVQSVTGSDIVFTSGLSSGDAVAIVYSPSIERESGYTSGGSLRAPSLNLDITYGLSLSQYLKTELARSVKVADADSGSAPEISGSLTSGELVQLNSAGTTLISSGLNADDLSSLNLISADISTVAGISSDVTAVAADASDIGTVSTNIANVNAVGTNISNVNAVNANETNINIVATDLDGDDDIGTVATNIADVNTVATNIINIGTVASNDTNITAVADDIANVNTVATNIAGVNSFAERYRVGATDPVSDLNEGDLFYNTTGNVLKYYDGSAWINVESSDVALSGNNTWTGTNVFQDVVDVTNVNAEGSGGGNLRTNGGTNCLSWGGGGSANLSLGGNMSGASTHKLVNMADGTSAQDYVTKAQLDANTPPDASPTVKGIVELATNAETITGTDTVRAITPAGLKAATDALDIIGTGQTWQNLTASRAPATTYTNSTGKPIQVAISILTNVATNTFTIDGVIVFSVSAGTQQMSLSFIIPDGSTYKFDGSVAGTVDWSELR